MHRLRAAARYLPLFVFLAASAGLAPASGQPGECAQPVARRASTDEPPTDRERPVPAQAPRGPAAPPATPFPPAGGGLPRPSANDPPVPSVAVRVRVPAEVAA